MSTSKLFRAKGYNSGDKRSHVTRRRALVLGSASSYSPFAIPHNSRLQRLKLRNMGSQVSKVIVVKINPLLDQVAEKPLNSKAAEAKNMFANYRKSH